MDTDSSSTPAPPGALRDLTADEDAQKRAGFAWIIASIIALRDTGFEALDAEQRLCAEQLVAEGWRPTPLAAMQPDGQWVMSLLLEAPDGERRREVFRFEFGGRAVLNASPPAARTLN